MADTAVLCPDLTEYELRLCGYTIGVVRVYREEPGFLAEIAPGLRRTRLHELIFGADAMDELRACPVTERELADLYQALDSPPTGTKWLWQPYEPLYRKYWDTVPEVRRLATPRMLQDWTDACGRFTDRLKADDLPLAEGLDTMRDWIRLLRELVRACGDQPREKADRRAEPSFDPRADFEALPQRIKKAIIDIRAAIRGKPDWKQGDPPEGKPLGDQATSTQLRNRTSLATKTLYDALYWMNGHREYAPEGYKPRRNKARRFQG